MKKLSAILLIFVLNVPAQSFGEVSDAKPVNPATGAAQFARCTSCHNVGPSQRVKMGPDLRGIMGKKAATADQGYNYSTALKSSGIIWSAKELDRFLLSPSKAVPGNKMTAPGIPNAETRVKIIQYIEKESVK